MYTIGAEASQTKRNEVTVTETLKTALGDLYDEATSRIEEYNLQNPDNPLNIVNFSSGNYVTQEEHTKEISEIKKDYAVNLALTKSGARNLTAAKSLMDLDKITIEDGEICGIDEQIKMLKREDSFLFETEKLHGVMHGSGEVLTAKESFIRDILENQVKR